MKEEVMAQEEPPPVRYYYEETSVNGMKYGVFVGVGKASNGYLGAGGVCVINITKDELEAEKLRKELGK